MRVVYSSSHALGAQKKNKKMRLHQNLPTQGKGALKIVKIPSVMAESD